MPRPVDPWIKVEKTLASDPRIRVMARRLYGRGELAGKVPEPTLQTLLATCVGAVVMLWITADSFVDDQDVLAMGPADIDELTGIQGFCDLMPAEWLQVINEDTVKLPGFHAHNGTKAKKKAVDQKRQNRHRHAMP